MTTQAQIQANRSNAQKSTGPRTPEGKAVVSQNAVKHGLLARHVVIAGEDPGQFETYRDQMLAELNPEGSVESMLAHRAVGLAWRLLRAERLQNEAFDALYERNTTSPLARLQQAALAAAYGHPQTLHPKGDPQPASDEADHDLTLGRVVVKDFANTRVLDRLLMYERRLEHSLFKTIAELQRLRLLRQWTAPKEAAETTPERTDASAVPNRAKQTQFPTTQTTPNRISKNELQHNRRTPAARKQTQSNPVQARSRANSFSPGPALMYLLHP